MTTIEHPLIQALYRVEGKAEIVNGKIVPLPMTGEVPGYAGDAISASLFHYARRTQRGRAVGDGKGFLTDLPHRQSFSPDVAFYTGPLSGMKFYPQAPDFAVEVRSENDYGPAAERAMAAKRADYFAAGTKLVVWDVDLLSVTAWCASIRNGDADQSVRPPPAAVRLADAEPAVPWLDDAGGRSFRRRCRVTNLLPSASRPIPPTHQRTVDQPAPYYPRHECGVFGIFNHPNAAALTYYGLFALQHRGQESAGMVTATGTG